MNLPALSIKNYQFVLIVIAAGIFLGVSSLMNMPRNEDPSPDFPFFNLVAVYPGTSPQDIEELVVDPLEEAIDELDDIKDITTKIEEGLALIQIETEFGIDIPDKEDELIRVVKSVEPDLPEDLYSLDISRFDPSKDVKIQQLAITGAQKSIAELEKTGEDLEKELEKLPEVEDAELLAYAEEQIAITVDFDRMAAAGISLNHLVSTLQNNNLNIPAGTIEAGAKSFSIQSSGSYKTTEDIERSIVGQSGESIVQLGDVANVEKTRAEETWIGRYNGERALFLTITQASDINLVKLGEKINEKVATFQNERANGIEIATVFEQAPAVKARVNGFFSNLLQGVLLVGLVIFLFLGFRPSIIIMAVIPLSIVIGVAVLNESGYALQQISIAALVIALGLLVDNGIVVVENIQRYIKEGFPIKEAAIKGTSEVGGAIVSSTLTTLLAFVPLLTLETGAGEFLRTLPLTVIYVLVISLVLALTFTPMLSGRLMRPAKASGARVTKATSRFIEKFYTPVLNGALKRGWLVVLIGVSLFMGSFALFPAIGVSFFPTADKPILLIEVDAPRGSSIDRTDLAVNYVESILDTMNFVTNYSSNVGHGNPTIYYNRIGENYKSYHGQVLVNFEAWEPTTFYQTLNELRYQFAQYPDARITFSELKNGPPFEAPIEIKVIGKDLEVLKQLSYKVEEVIERTEGTLDIDNPLRVPKTDIALTIKEDKVAMAGVPIPAIDQALRTAVTGLSIDELSIDQEKYDLVVQTSREDNSIGQLSNAFVGNVFGDQVPLKQLASLEFKPAVAQILHHNTERSTSVTANVINPDQTTAITESIIEQLDALTLPDGYSFYIAGEYEGQQESFGGLGTLLILALLGIFGVLVLQFRSFIQPLIVFSAIPLAVTGSFVALYLTGWPFSLFAFVGFISLVGIVVNNSIILVDYTNQLMNGGMEKIEAIKKACETRFTPILLTTTTTILGLVPLTFSASGLWSPMGWTIIGGMLSSTLLTLLVVPVLYKWMTKTPVVVKS